MKRENDLKRMSFDSLIRHHFDTLLHLVENGQLERNDSLFLTGEEIIKRINPPGGVGR